jgi:hypothetical protein
MPRSIISFGFEGSFIINGFEAGIAFKELSKTASYIKTLFLTGTKVEAETEAKAEAGTRGTEIKAGVTLAIKPLELLKLSGL